MEKRIQKTWRERRWEKIIDMDKAVGTRSCNCCGVSNYGDQPVNIHTINLGANGSSLEVAMCAKCLNEFSDKLWQYLEEV